MLKINAIVDPHGVLPRHWSVTVWDVDIADRRKTYCIEAGSDHLAAIEAMRRFEDEFTE